MYLFFALISALSSLLDFPLELFLLWSIIESETMLSPCAKLIPRIPFEDLPLNIRNFFELNLIHLPNFVPNITSWSSLQIFTPIILSSLSNFIAILPDVLIDEKSSKLFFLIFPLLVAKTNCIFFNADCWSGKGIIELIDWWFLSGKILNKDFPLEAAVPSGIFQDFSL